MNFKVGDKVNVPLVGIVLPVAIVLPNIVGVQRSTGEIRFYSVDVVHPNNPPVLESKPGVFYNLPSTHPGWQYGRYVGLPDGAVRDLALNATIPFNSAFVEVPH